jgi:plastocyanin
VSIVHVVLRMLALGLLSLLPQFVTAASLVLTLTDRDGNPVDDAVLYVSHVNGQTATVAPQQVSVDQVNEAFVPHVRAITTGSSVVFPNSDHIRHHVYSFSPVKQFELPLYIGVPAAPVTFDTAGLVTLGCNIHDHMLGYILVLDTPWYAEVTAGAARIDDLPDGELVIGIWHPRLVGDQALQLNAQTAENGPTVLQQQVELLPERRVRRAPRRGSNNRY